MESNNTTAEINGLIEQLNEADKQLIYMLLISIVKQPVLRRTVISYLRQYYVTADSEKCREMQAEIERHGGFGIFICSEEGTIKPAYEQLTLWNL